MSSVWRNRQYGFAQTYPQHRGTTWCPRVLAPAPRPSRRSRFRSRPSVPNPTTGKVSDAPGCCYLNSCRAALLRWLFASATDAQARVRTANEYRTMPIIAPARQQQQQQQRRRQCFRLHQRIAARARTGDFNRIARQAVTQSPQALKLRNSRRVLGPCVTNVGSGCSRYSRRPIAARSSRSRFLRTSSATG
jgi:hypothetical protein